MSRKLSELRRQLNLRVVPPLSVNATSAETSGGEPGHVMRSAIVVAGCVPTQKRTAPTTSMPFSDAVTCGRSTIQDSI